MTPTAVITGGAQGIGKSIAERLGKDGFNIVISDMNIDLANQTVEGFKNQGLESIAVEGNVPDKKTNLSLFHKLSKPLVL